jgi:hypothetical protein
LELKEANNNRLKKSIKEGHSRSITEAMPRNSTFKANPVCLRVHAMFFLNFFFFCFYQIYIILMYLLKIQFKKHSNHNIIMHYLKLVPKKSIEAMKRNEELITNQQKETPFPQNE